MRTIVIDIDDPNDVSRLALAAMRNVLQPGDQLHFFHHVYHQDLGQNRRSDRVLDEARDLLCKARTEQMAQLATHFPSLKSKVHVEWTEHGWQSLLQYVASVDADLVVTRSSRGPRFGRLSGPHDDWQLIRHTKVPLLLLRPECAHRYDRIIAAIDPLHVDDKPAELDRRILTHAAEMARRHNARLTVLNVVAVTMSAPGLSVPGTITAASKRAIAAHNARVSTLIHELDIEVDQKVVIPGIPAREIIRTSVEQQADLVVMGAVARSTLRNLLIGNTAEKVLDQLGADTLVIKPANRTARGATRAPLAGRDRAHAAQSLPTNGTSD